MGEERRSLRLQHPLLLMTPDWTSSSSPHRRQLGDRPRHLQGIAEGCLQLVRHRALRQSRRPDHLQVHGLPVVGGGQHRAAVGLSFVAPHYAISLPLGISFFSFQAISYLADVHARRVAASKSFIDFGTYKSFFPQLIAGPIVRYAEVNQQLRVRQLTIDNIFEGMWRFSLGLGKKILIADPLATIVDGVLCHAGGRAHERLGVARRPLLRVPDLLRFLRLLGHGNRARQGLRLQFPRRTSTSPIGRKASRSFGAGGT